MELDTKVPGFLNAEKGVENMGKALKLLARVLMGMDAKTIAKVIEADAGKWDESKHPRGKGGKFASKGSGGGGSEKGAKGEKSSSAGSEVGVTVKNGNKSPAKGKAKKTAREPKSGYDPFNGEGSKTPAQKGKSNQQHGGINLSERKSFSEQKKLDDVARKYGYKDAEHMRLCAVGMASPSDYVKTKSGYMAPTILSPVHEEVSVSKRDTNMKDAFSKVATDKAGMKKLLDDAPAGTMLRYNERGYSIYTKQNDGTWTYQNAYSSKPSPTTTDKIFDDVQAYKDPKTGKSEPENAIQGIATPKEGNPGRNAEWDARRAVANLEPNAGDSYRGKKVSLADAKKNAMERVQNGKFKEASADEDYVSSEYTKTDISEDGVIHSAGVPVGKLKNGSGVTGISKGDIVAPNPDREVYNTLAEHCMENSKGELVLTPEREKLHQDIMEETFSKANPVKPGEKKTFTMLGGGSAAGKGTIQKMMPQLFNQDSPVIDADEMKKRIPEYVDTAFSPDHDSAASLAHEESSALAKRAMQTAFANGYNCTLDGTGDGSLKSMQKKIKDAQNNGYTVEGVYVTCPTELAVERNANRSKTDEYNRLVGESAVRDIHKKVSQIFPHVAPMMDHVVLYDTNQPKGAAPKKIAECWKGQKIQVLDPKLYQAFLDKGNE